MRPQLDLNIETDFFLSIGQIIVIAASNFDEFRHTPLQGGRKVGLSKETDFLGYTYKRKKDTSSGNIGKALS